MASFFAWPGYVTYGSPAGKATITCTLERQKRTCVFWVRGALADAEVSPVADQTYTGSAIKPKPTVTYGGKTLKEGTDYTLAWKNYTKVGTATITITGKGAYTGTATVTFKIVEKPKPVEPAVPVYRLYNKRSGDHHYTTSAGERDALTSKHGWKGEGIGFYGVRAK